ncbi:MAG: nucleotidyltransferase domain-containing protein [Chloroflexi bacterium]|nr:nucleotidyltransferase domain-containing protein [Chloroflexota bacterium]
MQTQIVQTILSHFPQTQAVYLFGSYGTAQEWPDSDVDIAVLLPPTLAKQIGSLTLSKLHLALTTLLNKEVDPDQCAPGVYGVPKGNHHGRTAYLLRG